MQDSRSFISGRSQHTADTSSGGVKERLLNRSSTSGYLSYGSISNHRSGTDTPKQAAFHQQKRLAGTKENDRMDPQRRERLISTRNVYLPPQKWYKRLHIPGVFNFRGSPHSNSIHTTKYTIINFFFKNLWEQFHRLANIYFLFIPMLNFVPAVEAFGKEVGFIPLLFVLSVTMVKDAFEDFRRYRSDREVNRRLCRVYDWMSGSYVAKQWRHVRVGDFIELRCDEVIPADILVLSSTDPGQICYIETANIDGETSLKQRQVAPSGVHDEDPPSEHFNPSRFVGELHAEEPHSKIYEFNGYIQEPNGVRTSVNRNHLLLRGCVLRNTTLVTGIVVYAGHQTKALLNNSGPRAKRSKLERDINTEIVSQVVILAILCISGAIASSVWTARNINKSIPFFPFNSDNIDPALEGFIRFWTFLILFQVIIPISLYVTMEVVKFTQIYFLNWDRAMYYAPTDRPFECRALNITEDLGQIQYVFSDKTGTLTENEMVFKCCSIGSINYPHSLKDEFTKYGVDINASMIMHTAALEGDHDYEKQEETDFPQPLGEMVELDPLLLTSVRNQTLSEAYIRDFFITMAICNTVVVVSKNGRDAKRNQQVDGQNEDRSVTKEDIFDLSYEAESPDEAALVEAARAYGYALVSRSHSYCAVSAPNGKLLEFDVLHVLEFDSNRKCMSVVARQRGDDRVVLYSKGADSVIYKNLRHQYMPRNSTMATSENEAKELNDMVANDLTHSESNESSIRVSTNSHLDMFARLGLRTLCLARRVFTVEEYSEWATKRNRAEIALEDRDILLHETALSAEMKLELLGATGIEDRLQDGVPEAIESLRKAGMKVWVLTGDKQETAINIGYSSCQIDPSMDLIIINAYTLDHCRMELEHCHREFYPNADGEHSLDSNDSFLTRIPLLKSVWRKNTCDDPIDYRGKLKALVIDGGTLLYVLDPSLKKLFLDVAKKCHSVICCRVSPLQKAAVVELVKKNLNQMTLAIGDGANDVSMIQKAHVGVGISGREGMQAVMASDFAMARFKFLVRLLLVHGHWSYSRLANMMLYFFYKNVTYAVLIFWFQIFNGFSGSNPIDGINLLIFNLIYTSLPIMVVAVTDQDLRSDVLLKDETLYNQGRCSTLYTRLKFWLTMLDAFYESAVVFFVAYATYYRTDVGVVEFGFVVNISVVIVVSLHLAVETQHWTIVNHVILWGSVAVTFIFNYVYCAIDSRQRLMDTLWVMQMASTRAEFWFVLLLTPVIALFPRMVAKVIEQELFPSAVLTARAKEKRSRFTKKVLVDVPPETFTQTPHLEEEIHEESGEQNVTGQNSII